MLGIYHPAVLLSHHLLGIENGVEENTKDPARRTRLSPHAAGFDVLVLVEGEQGGYELLQAVTEILNSVRNKYHHCLLHDE